MNCFKIGNAQLNLIDKYHLLSVNSRRQNKKLPHTCLIVSMSRDCPCLPLKDTYPVVVWKTKDRATLCAWSRSVTPFAPPSHRRPSLRLSFIASVVLLCRVVDSQVVERSITYEAKTDNANTSVCEVTLPYCQSKCF